MKLSQIDWTDGKQYKGYYLYGTAKIWTVKSGSLVNSLGDITEIYPLEIISEIDFEPWVDWSKVKVDTKLLVSNNGTQWDKRYFAKYEDGKIYCFMHGATSWSIKADYEISIWKYAKLAESEANNDTK